MKSILILAMFVTSLASASSTILKAGEKIIIQPNTQMTVSCTGGGNTQEPSCPSTSLAVVKCLNLGYMPNSCAGLKKCSASQYACLDKGYMPNSCESL